MNRNLRKYFPLIISALLLSTVSAFAADNPSENVERGPGPGAPPPSAGGGGHSGGGGFTPPPVHNPGPINPPSHGGGFNPPPPPVHNPGPINPPSHGGGFNPPPPPVHNPGPVNPPHGNQPGPVNPPHGNQPGPVNPPHGNQPGPVNPPSHNPDPGHGGNQPPAPIHGNPGHGGGHPIAPGPVTIHNGNRVPPSAVTNINNSRDRMNHDMHGNQQVTSVVNRIHSIYENQHKTDMYRNSDAYDRFRQEDSPRYRNVWGPQYHFWGFGWDSPRVVNVEIDYQNPCFFYFYADETTWDDNYFRTWYGADYDTYPDLRVRFRRPWAFYPSQAFEDLVLGASVWEVERQLEFRAAMSDLTVRLEETLTEELGQTVVLGESSIFVDHYQLLDNAVVLDGSVYVNGTAYPYEAFIDLDDTSQDLVYVPTTYNEDPSSASIDMMNLLNSTIVQQGGVLEDAQ